MTQPEALRLADALDKRVVPRWVHSTGQTPRQSGYDSDIECAQAAAELRRLHDLLGKANALCRIRLDRIEKMEAVMVNAQGNLERISLVQTGVGIGTQAQRQWVSLTEEEIDELSRTMVKSNKSVNWLCRTLEAKIREKNT